jgi:general secretion pathway protein G
MGYCVLGSMEAHKDMNKHQRIGIRIATSASVGILVAAIATIVAWRNIRAMWEVRPEQRATRQAIFEIEDLVHAYYASTAALPKSLEEVRGASSLQVSFQWDEKGRPLDGWGHPFLYSTADTKYVITSLGRDAKPGGLGLDCDLSNLTTWPSADALLTFGQFLTHPVTRPSIWVCAVCGLVAFLMSMQTVHASALHGWGLLSLIVKLTFTTLGALFAAFIMSMLEIPTH